MPRVLRDDGGPMLMVEGAGGVPVPVARNVYERAFPPAPDAPVLGAEQPLPTPEPVLPGAGDESLLPAPEGAVPLGMAPGAEGPAPALTPAPAPAPAPAEDALVTEGPAYQVKGRGRKAQAQPVQAPDPDQVKPGGSSTDEQEQMARDAVRKEQGATRGVAEVDSAEDREIASYLDQSNERIAGIDEKQQEAHARGLAAVEASRNETAELRQKYIDTKIDRNRLVKNMPLWRKILLGVSTGLSIVGKTMSGRGDEPLEIVSFIEGQIEKDIADQKDTRAQLGESIKQKETVYGEIKQRTQDEYQAAELTKAAVLAEVKRKVEAIQKYSESDRTRANAELMVAKLDGRIAEITAGFGQRREDKAYKDAQMKLQKSQVAQSWARLKWDKEKADMQMKAAQAKAAAEGVIRNPITNEIMGRVAPGFKPADVAASVTGAAQYRKGLTELYAKYQEMGRANSFTDPQAVREYNDMRRSLGAKLAMAENPGRAPTDADIENAMTKIPEAKGWTDRTDAESLFKRKVQEFDDDHAMYLRSVGFSNEQIAGYQNVLGTVQDGAGAPGDDGTKSPAERALGVAEGGRSTQHRVSGLQTFAKEMRRKPGSAVGGDYIRRVRGVVQEIQKDPGATRAQKEWAKNVLTDAVENDRKARAPKPKNRSSNTYLGLPTD